MGISYVMREGFEGEIVNIIYNSKFETQKVMILHKMEIFPLLPYQF
jgi:hypothetical protein